jgi:DNA-binding NtrC family response regulator
MDTVDGTEILTGDAPAARAPAAWVIDLEGRRPRWIPADGLVLGARPGLADLVLGDPAVSGRHLRLQPVGDELELRDLDSRNGSWVDGVRVVSARLRETARVRLGRTYCTVRRWLPDPGDAGGLGSPSPGLVAESPEMRAIVTELGRLARLPWAVLILGETGVGKEEVARALHRESPRARRPFVPVNAGGLPRDLVESELFGHERGAFTGASRAHRGVFEQADGGTLFLDEIGELDLPLQARLLRVLEVGEIRRVGGEAALPVDVRLVTATHRDLGAAVRAGSFREDLYYRIARTVLAVPPLRRRTDDVAPLAGRFLASMAPEVGQRSLSPQAEAVLRAYDWPGNARELRNVLSMATAVSDRAVLDATSVRMALARQPRASGAGAGPVDVDLRALVQDHGGNLSAAARALGIPRSTLRDRLTRARAPHQRTIRPA